MARSQAMRSTTTPRRVRVAGRAAATLALTAASFLAASALAPPQARADELPPTAAQRAMLPRAAAPPVRPVPPPPPPPVSRTRLNCGGCAVAGGIVLGAGAAHALVGGIELSDPAPGEENRGRVLLVLAGVHGLVGLPLLVFGLWPVEGTGARAAAAASNPVDLRLGPTGGSLRVAF
jgi:hypothetical protein